VLRFFPGLAPLEATFTYWRYIIATIVLVIALFLVHKWLPAGKRKLSDIAPGIAATLIAWMICGITFGRYLADFALKSYVSYYAGLSSVMIALVFLYFTSLIFVLGGEFNHALRTIKREAKLATAPD
jgi:membrane protein